MLIKNFSEKNDERYETDENSGDDARVVPVETLR